MGHPTPSDWKRHEELIRAGTKGFNHMEAIPRILPKEYPWLKDFEIGFFSADDIPMLQSIGWRFLETSHFDTQSFNEAIGLRFGLSEDAGRIKYLSNYLMIIPRDIDEKKRRARNDENDKLFAAQTDGQKYVHPSDPRASELINSGSVKSDYETATIIPTEAKKRGRPPKRG